MKVLRLQATGYRSESDRSLCFQAAACSLRPVALAIVVAIAMTGCGSIEPWVKPYERAALADPIMAGARNPVADEFMFHVFEVREGARGASGSAGGGCGCN
ncbi:MAG TPA: DUF4266 domain-containing protein [Steroidobacteraceae bacterium]|nr:DUF4266 domain-containing protein [Steroidobacteraceae bacterium]